jgi:hypothetical protein
LPAPRGVVQLTWLSINGAGFLQKLESGIIGEADVKQTSSGITVLELERRRKRLSKLALGRAGGFDASWVSHVEAGRWAPSPDSPIMRKLALLFGRSPEDLIRVIPDEELDLMIARVAETGR